MTTTGPDLFEMTAEVEGRIGDLNRGDSYSVYELMYEAACRMAPIGCFYVCIYSAESGLLHFAYNRDGDALEEPLTLPLGDGPTSWVVRNRRPLILTDKSEVIQRRGVRFGDRSRVSHSALHLPMRTVGPKGESVLVGVVSAQSYEPNAFGPEQIGVLQSLADRAGRILHLDFMHEGCQRQIAALEDQIRRRQERTDRISSDFIERLTEMSHQLRAVIKMTPGDLHELREAEAVLNRSLHKILTIASEAPAHLDEAHPKPAPRAKPEQTPIADLTEREMEIATLLASGRSNAAIAAELFVSVGTVKFHCANLYRKLRVRNRIQAVQAAAALLSGKAA